MHFSFISMSKSVKMKTIVVVFLIAVCFQNTNAIPLGDPFADLIRQHLGGGGGGPISTFGGGDSSYPPVRVMSRVPSRGGSFSLFGDSDPDEGRRGGRSGGGLFKPKDSNAGNSKSEENRGIRRPAPVPVTVPRTMSMPWGRRPW